MTENKRFRVTIGNENDVRLVDYIDNRQLISISFKDYKDAVDCRDALLYQCNMLNELHEENKKLKNEVTLLDMKLADKEKAFEKLHNMYVEAIKENKELKKRVGDKEVAVEVETCKLMEKVFKVIDEKIKELEEQMENEALMESPAYYHGINYGLETFKELKKELEDGD